MSLLGCSSSSTVSHEIVDETFHPSVTLILRLLLLQVMSASRVGVTAGLCDLIAGMTSGVGCATFGPNLAIELEKLYVYSLIWSVGGLLEFEDRSVTDRQIAMSVCADLGELEHWGAGK